MLSQEPQRQKGSQSEGLAGVTGRWKGVNQEMQTWWRYQPLTQPESSPFPERCGQDPWKTSLALASLVGLSGEGGADNVLLPVSQLLLSRFLLQDLSYLLTLGVCPQTRERHSPSISHLASGMSQDLVGPWENMGCREKPSEQGTVYFMDDSGSLAELWQQCN